MAGKALGSRESNNAHEDSGRAAIRCRKLVKQIKCNINFMIPESTSPFWILFVFVVRLLLFIWRSGLPFLMDHHFQLFFSRRPPKRLVSLRASLFEQAQGAYQCEPPSKCIYRLTWCHLLPAWQVRLAELCFNRDLDSDYTALPQERAVGPGQHL